MFASWSEFNLEIFLGWNVRLVAGNIRMRPLWLERLFECGGSSWFLNMGWWSKADDIHQILRRAIKLGFSATLSNLYCFEDSRDSVTNSTGVQISVRSNSLQSFRFVWFGGYYVALKHVHIKIGTYYLSYLPNPAHGLRSTFRIEHKPRGTSRFPVRTGLVFSWMRLDPQLETLF